MSMVCSMQKEPVSIGGEQGRPARNERPRRFTRSATDATIGFVMEIAGDYPRAEVYIDEVLVGRIEGAKLSRLRNDLYLVEGRWTGRFPYCAWWLQPREAVVVLTGPSGETVRLVEGWITARDGDMNDPLVSVEARLTDETEDSK